MSFEVLVTPQAEDQLRQLDVWWQQNRAGSPDLVLREFERVLILLQEMPHLGSLFRGASIPGVRRLLLRGSDHWVYYLPDDARSVVYVLAVWSTRRGSNPPFAPR